MSTSMLLDLLIQKYHMKKWDFTRNVTDSSWRPWNS